MTMYTVKYHVVDAKVNITHLSGQVYLTEYRGRLEGKNKLHKKATKKIKINNSKAKFAKTSS